ncbi:MAG: hypothetical protein OEX07_11445, partial [Gammaproteobacteria bacterium]|nr:hypothetical protein [Gammaproteobacteria bacterium]
LTWTKNNCFYAVGADLIQRLHTGIDVILNGSLHNLEEATKQFPNLNTVLVQKEGSIVREQSNRYLITEDDEVKLEWSDQETDLGHPYILTLQSEHSMDNAVDMLISLVTYEKSCLDKVV